MTDKKTFIPQPAVAALTPAWRALEEGNYGEALKLANAYLNDTNISTHREAAKVVAPAHFHLGNYGAALPLFTEIAEHEPTPTHWMSVLTAATLSHNMNAADGALARIEQLYRVRSGREWNDEVSLDFVLYYFIQALCDVGEFSSARIMLDRLCKTYETATIENGSALLTPRAPSVELFLAAAHRVFHGLNDIPGFRTWLERLSGSVNTEAVSNINQWLEKISH